MRLLIPVAVVFALSLACAGSFGELGKEPMPLVPPPPPPEVLVGVPVQAPVPEPPAPSDVLAAVAPFSGGDVAVVCTSTGQVVQCPVGPCPGEDYSQCEAGPEVKVVGMATLSEGTFALPLAMATLTRFADMACDWPAAEIMEGDATTTPRPVAVVAEDDAALAPLEALASDTSTVTSAYRLDLDGKPGDEIVAEIATEMGSFLAVLRPDGSTVTIFDNRREPLPEDASEELQMEYMTTASTLTWVGMTDAENDGALEFVLEGSGYEASWIVIMALHGDAVGSVGCAV